MISVVINVEAGWAVVIAALGSSVLTAFGLLALEWRKGRRDRKTRKLAAYQNLLTQSMAAVQTAGALRLTMKLRSGLKEGWDIALRHRKLLEPLDLADRLQSTFQPLFAAQAAIQELGSDESVPLADTLVRRCVDLIKVATEDGQSGSKTTRYVFGERWSEEQENAFVRATEEVGESRNELAALLRAEGG